MSTINNFNVVMSDGGSGGKDEIANFATTEASIISFEENIVKLSKSITDLEKNKEAFGNSWSSANADIYLGKYDAIIGKLTAAYTSLTNYQKKLDQVYKDIVEFDKSITG